MEAYSDLELVPFLYNTCYGGYGFSREFMTRLNERRAAAGFDQIKYDIDLQRKKYRSDPMITTLYQEMGSEAASGDFAQLTCDWIPKEFLPYVDIHEYDGTESVGVPILEVEADLLRAFLSEWKKNPELDVDDLNQRYETLQGKWKRYTQYRDEKYGLR
jgi:hypothetical protein